MTCTRRSLTYAMLVIGTFSLIAFADAPSGNVSESSPPAKVIAHLRLSDSGMRRMFLRQKGKSRYLYVQRVSQPGFTIIDVTYPGRPKVVRPVQLETRTIVGAGVMITETPHPSASPGTNREAGNGDTYAVPESVHVLEVSDPASSRTVGASGGAASVLQDPARSLIYVANGEGVWILSTQGVFNIHPCSSTDATSSLPDCN